MIHNGLFLLKDVSHFPDYIPDIDCNPVDTLATIILEIAHFVVAIDKAWIHNITNHKPIWWPSLVDTVKKRLGPHTQIVLGIEGMDLDFGGSQWG